MGRTRSCQWPGLAPGRFPVAGWVLSLPFCHHPFLETNKTSGQRTLGGFKVRAPSQERDLDPLEDEVA